MYHKRYVWSRRIPPRLCRLRGRSRTVATFIEFFLTNPNQLIEVARISLEMQEMGAILRAWGWFLLDSLFSSNAFFEGRKTGHKNKNPYMTTYYKVGEE
jgi:hypothetical protein